MRRLIRPAIMMAALLTLLILPFLAFGQSLESWAESLKDSPPSPWQTAAIIIGLLSTDILLPVPSSVISTLGGWQLGWLWGTLVSWIGMSVGAMIGFACARQWGKPFARWMSSEDDLNHMESLSDRFGPILLIVARGIPVFAEASVLLVGMHKLAWKKFLTPVLLANLGISIAYAAFGEVSERHDWLPLAIGVSIALPVVMVLMVRAWFWTRPSDS